MSKLIIRKVDLPLTIRSTTICDNDGDYNVYINTKLSADEQEKRFRMEIDKIKRGEVFSLESLLQMSGPTASVGDV